jgi:phenazine biosynthesis protein phzE
LTILKRFIHNEFGSYMNFCFFDGERFFIGASPERHLSIFKGTAYLNPISGTMPKAQADFKQAMLHFLQDPKEIHELFQVVDEELKMMAKICKRGGDIEGPFLKEMRTLIHTEYLLKGETNMHPLDAFRETMYAPTMIGSPLENACRIIYKYEKDSRRYYSSAMLMLGEDGDGEPFMDSTITIRTMELDIAGRFTVQAGASIVRDSVPERERIEVTTKSLGAIKAITESRKVEPILEQYMDAALEETFLTRNIDLSTFWLHKQSRTFRDAALEGKSVVIVDNEDNFAYMLAHMLAHLGLTVHVEKIGKMSIDPNDLNEDIVILSAGPGDPTNEDDERIARLNMLARRLLVSQKRFMGICFGHQVICRNLGLRLERLEVPLQGVQRDILLFGEKETVGFYNTFVAMGDDFLPASVEASVNEAGEVNALKGLNFASFQFHVESVLTRNGLEILKKALRTLFDIEN